jgi:hypothetical protein
MERRALVLSYHFAQHHFAYHFVRSAVGWEGRMMMGKMMLGGGLDARGERT